VKLRRPTHQLFVHRLSLGRMGMEASHIDEIAILTLATRDGFTVSFGLTVDDLARLEKTFQEARTRARPEFIRN
jgi:hypothetical protein